MHFLVVRVHSDGDGGCRRLHVDGLALLLHPSRKTTLQPQVVIRLSRSSPLSLREMRSRTESILNLVLTYTIGSGLLTRFVEAFSRVQLYIKLLTNITVLARRFALLQ